MRNKTKLFTNVAFILAALVAVSCSVDKAYDLSKDVDMTVSVAEGITIPLGSTEKIMLSELLDTLDSDVIKVDNESGFYSIKESGTIDATTFKVNDVDITVTPFSDSYVYNFDVNKIETENLPPHMQEAILETEFAYSMYDVIDENKVEYDIHQSVPKEMESLTRMTFKEKVILDLDIEISATETSKEYTDFIDKVHLHTSGDSENFFYVEMPSYLQFAEGTPMDGNKLFLKEVIERGTKGVKHFDCSYEIVAFDFSHEPNGGLEVVDGYINIVEDDLVANGVLWSDTIFMKVKDLKRVSGVKVKPTISFSKMRIDSVYGRVKPEINPVETTVDINISDNLDNLHFDFTNPQLFVTVDNHSPAAVIGDVQITGYKNGKMIDGSSIETTLNIEPMIENKYYISRQGGTMEGYTSLQIPNLNNLLKTVPDKIELYLEPYVDDTRLVNVKLGETLSVKGSYSLLAPMEFNSFSLEYTERIEDILGDNPEDITDYITDINSVTLSFVIENTVPAGFTPTIIPYKKDGVTRLDNVVVDVSGEIAAGKGYKDGKLTEPVETTVTIKLSAKEGELGDLSIIDFVINGSGSGALNINEYIQIKNMSIKIDEPIEVDLN